MNDERVDHVVWFRNQVRICNRGGLKFFNIFSVLDRSIPLFRKNDPCSGTVFLTDVTSQNLDISHIDYRRRKRISDLPVCVGPEAWLCQWRTVRVVSEVPCDVSISTKSCSKCVQHFARSKSTTHIVSIPQMIQWNVNSCIWIDACQRIICQTELVGIDFCILI